MAISIGQKIIDGNYDYKEPLYSQGHPIKSFAVYCIPGIKLYLSTDKEKTKSETPIMIGGLGLFQVEGLSKAEGTAIYRIDIDQESVELLNKAKTKLYLDYIQDITIEKKVGEI